jgi:hypothetical protein
MTENSIPMFPDAECFPMTDNVFIHHPPYEGCGYRLWFRVGVQYFQIGIERETLEEAEWSARMFVRALGKFKDGVDDKGED